MAELVKGTHKARTKKVGRWVSEVADVAMHLAGSEIFKEKT